MHSGRVLAVGSMDMTLLLGRKSMPLQCLCALLSRLGIYKVKNEMNQYHSHASPTCNHGSLRIMVHLCVQIPEVIRLSLLRQFPCWRLQL